MAACAAQVMPEKSVTSVTFALFSVFWASMSSKHPHLTAEELAEFREIFNLVDLDKGGTISKDELKQLMHTLACGVQEELNAMVERDRRGWKAARSTSTNSSPSCRGR